MICAVRANMAASPLTGPYALCAVRVPRAGASHSASFRLHLAVKTLAVPVGVPVIKVPRGLPPPRHFPLRFPFSAESARSWRSAPCLAHLKKSPAGGPDRACCSSLHELNAYGERLASGSRAAAAASSKRSPKTSSPKTSIWTGRPIWSFWLSSELTQTTAV